MANLENATPFGAEAFPSCDRDGRDVLLVVVGAQFVLPDPGEADPHLELYEPQETPPVADEYHGEPGEGSMRREGQSSYTKPATDICVAGDACAPNGASVTEMGVAIRVGPCTVALHVHGDRVWERSASLDARPSEPVPFVRMPLMWERAYGGVAASSTEKRPAFEPRNPLGCGFEVSAADAIGKPVPNLEDPRHPLTRLSDRPSPVGVGPIARHWQPRVSYVGTYDEAWRRDRAPLWPTDFDERFFCGAPASLQAAPHLSGGEPVVLRGLHPGGSIQFRLPTLGLRCVSRFLDRVVATMPVLDGVVIETDASRLTMYYRAAVPAPLSLVRHRETVLELVGAGEAGDRG